MLNTTWEIGKAGYPLQKVMREMQIAGFEINEIKKTYRVFEIPWHRFFVLSKDAEKARTNQGLIPEKLRMSEKDSGSRMIPKKENR